MRALVYHGPGKVTVDEVPDATIEKPTDALIRITTTNIPQSGLVVLDGAPHACNVSHQPEFNAALVSFLGR